MDGNMCIMTDDLIENYIIFNISITEDLDQEQLTKIIKTDGLDSCYVHTIKLEYYGLLNISNLWKFRLLSTLVLANNLIEEIEGIESLPNLQHLDLSFNRIKAIQGLKGLCNLVYLNLSFNEINTLKNMEILVKLESLIVRHNRIKSINCIRYLKQFKSLSCLGINGNPLMQSENIRFHIIACLPQLKFLDFKVISSCEFLEAINNYPCESTQQYHWLLDKSNALPWEKDVSDKKALVDGLVNGRGFDNFVNSDKNFCLLLTLPVVRDVAENFKRDATEVFDLWHQKGREYYLQMENEKAEFIEAVRNAKIFSEVHFGEEENKFTTFKEKVLQELCFLLYEKDSEESVQNLKQECLKELNQTYKNMLNFSTLWIDVIYDLWRIYDIEILKISEKYLKDIELLCDKIMKIDETYWIQLKAIYFRIFDSGSDFNLQDTDKDQKSTIEPKLLKLLSNKEFVDTALKMTLPIHESALKERVKKLRQSLLDFKSDTFFQVLSDNVLVTQTGWRRSIVIYGNKQKHIIDKIFMIKNFTILTF